MNKLRGEVIFFSKGFGFISVKDQSDVFFHYTNIKGEGFKKLNKGDKVEFVMAEYNGKPVASEIELIKE